MLKMGCLRYSEVEKAETDVIQGHLDTDDGKYNRLIE